MNQAILIKMTSLGDVVHTLPAIGDAHRAGLNVLDWVVERPFAAVPRMHAGVRHTVAVDVRHWRKNLWRPEVRSAASAFVRELRRERYDAVIDTQGLIKSALIAHLARGPRYGLDWRSAREPGGIFFHKTFHIPWTLHAVERNRLMVAHVLGYTVPAHLDYGITAPARRFDWLTHPAYAVLLHATSDDRKLWDESNWAILEKYFGQAGLVCVLPSGNAEERERSARLARSVPNAVVAPALELDALAGLLAGARVVVGTDTGLTHLAAALGVPTVGIYIATDPAATGIYGAARALNVGDIGKPPTAAAVVAAVDALIT